jgi:hypothetical protein
MHGGISGCRKNFGEDFLTTTKQAKQNLLGKLLTIFPR